MIDKTKYYTYRKIEHGDEEKIIKLIQLCLGNNPTRTIEFWRWKHSLNYFGPSYVLLVLDRDKLIGLRSFIKWQWKREDKVYNCVRAVDTVTHPNYRRQGLFSKLTFSLLDIMKSDGIDFVFNTPNDNSGPGNLKMGWKEMGKSNLMIIVTRADKLLLNRTKKVSINIVYPEHQFVLNEYLKDIVDADINRVQKGFRKNITSEYLAWRYQQVPYYKYGQITNKEFEYIIVFRTLNRGKLNELRITDLFFKDETIKGFYKSIKKDIKKLLSQYNCDVATITSENGNIINKVVRRSGFFNVGNKGLNFMLRSLNTEIDQFLNKEEWSYSSGDIEIF